MNGQLIAGGSIEQEQAPLEGSKEGSHKETAQDPHEHHWETEHYLMLFGGIIIPLLVLYFNVRRKK